eukprot:1192502-Prorocentrum_minimum.AAC.3
MAVGEVIRSLGHLDQAPTHARAHPRTHAPKHAPKHTRTRAPTNARTRTPTHACTNAPKYTPEHPLDACTHARVPVHTQATWSWEKSVEKAKEGEELEGNIAEGDEEDHDTVHRLHPSAMDVRR